MSLTDPFCFGVSCVVSAEICLWLFPTRVAAAAAVSFDENWNDKGALEMMGVFARLSSSKAVEGLEWIVDSFLDEGNPKVLPIVTAVGGFTAGNPVAGEAVGEEETLDANELVPVRVVSTTSPS